MPDLLTEFAEEVTAVFVIFVIAIVGLIIWGIVTAARHVNVGDIPSCEEGQVTCNGRCCNNAQTVNGICTCLDACEGSNTCTFNNVARCCPDSHPFCSATTGMCCTDGTLGDCVEGTVL